MSTVLKIFILSSLIIVSAGKYSALAQNTIRVDVIDSLFKYAERNSAAIKNNELQSLSAKWTKIASLGNTINLRSPFSASWTDNTKLPVSYLPAEPFGGPAGAFKQVSLGQEFVTSYALSPQIDIINPAAWSKVRSAELNKQLIEVNNLVAKKSLFESIAAAYYNVVSLQYQIIDMEKSVSAADSITSIVRNKYEAGIAREQDFNNATINALNAKDKLAQLKFSLQQNMLSLKILCDIPAETELQIINIEIAASSTLSKEASSSLTLRQAKLQTDFLKNEMTSNRINAFSPTLSFVFNQTWQRNSNMGFSENPANKFTAQYVGLRLTVPFPMDVNKLSANYTSKINYSIAKINSKHAELQNKASNKQLDLEYQKSNSSFNTAALVNKLKEDNYSKSLNQYSEGIISTDILLTALTDMINAKLNYSASFAGLKFNETKIYINNTIQ